MCYVRACTRGRTEWLEGGGQGIDEGHDVIVRNDNDTAKLDFTDDILFLAGKFLEQMGYGDRYIDAEVEMPNGWLSFTPKKRRKILMPKGYEKMRDKFKKEGMPTKAAKQKAARIWNASHPNNPVTGKKEPKRK